MLKYAICLSALALASCGTDGVTHVQTVVEKVPVAVQPITAAQVPTPPAPLPPRPSTPSAMLDVLLSKVCELEGYVEQADPLLRLSAGEHPQPTPDYKECRKH